MYFSSQNIPIRSNRTPKVAILVVEHILLGLKSESMRGFPYNNKPIMVSFVINPVKNWLRSSVVAHLGLLSNTMCSSKWPVILRRIKKNFTEFHPSFAPQSLSVLLQLYATQPML